MVTGSTENKVVSVRNLIDSDLGTTLRRFTGILDSMPQEDRQFGDATKGEKVRTTTYVNFNFKDIEPIETIEPYVLPIATISLGLSNRKKSKFGVFGESVVEILDMQYSKEQLDPANPAYIPPAKRADMASCIGKRMGLVMADGENGRPAAPSLFDGRNTDEKHPKGQDTDTPTWKVYMIEGVGVAGGQGKTPQDVAYEKLDGKTAQQFKQEAIVDPAIRGDGMLLASISAPDSAPNSFVNMAVSSGKFSIDATGVYHLKA